MLHNITKQVDDGFFLNEDDAFKNLNLLLFVKNSKVYIMSVLRKWGIPELKGNYSLLIHGPMECSQTETCYVIITSCVALILIS